MKDKRAKASKIGAINVFGAEYLSRRHDKNRVFYTYRCDLCGETWEYQQPPMRAKHPKCKLAPTTDKKRDYSAKLPKDSRRIPAALVDAAIREIRASGAVRKELEQEYRDGLAARPCELRRV